MLKIEETEGGHGPYGVLLCPHCGWSNTHVDDAYFIARRHEDDEPEMIHVSAGGDIDSADPPVADVTPSGRRGTIMVAGTCEECADTFAIAFHQHKGETHIYVR